MPAAIRPRIDRKDHRIAFLAYERQEPDLNSAYFHLTGTRWSTPAPHGGERHGGGQR